MDVEKGSENSNQAFDASGIIVAEFNYIAQSAFQAHEDRARVSQYFFVTFGTLVAALLTTQIENIDQRQLYIAFSVIFSLLAVFGALTMLHLARMRQAWIESARAMSQIKDTAIRQTPELADFFRWKTETIPPAFKPFSVGFLMAVMVSLLSGLSIGAAAAFFGLVSNPTTVNWPISIIAGLGGSGLLLVFLYYLPLRK